MSKSLFCQNNETVGVDINLNDLWWLLRKFQVFYKLRLLLLKKYCDIYTFINNELH